MQDFFRSIKFRIILCLAACLVGIMLHSVTQNGEISAGSELINTLTAPFHYISAAVSENLDSKADFILNSKKYKTENEQLRDELTELRNELVDYENTKAELEELKKFVGIKENHSDYVQSPPCKVLSYTANDPFYSFVIDKGSRDGISLHDPVVTAEGLVGAICEISEKYSTVRTILSPDISVGVKAVSKNETGILEGDIQFAVDGMSKIIYIEKDNSLSEGDIIITTGSSGMFPYDYLVGKINYIGISDNGLSCYATVKPFVDVRKLTSVTVITAFDGKGEIDDY